MKRMRFVWVIALLGCGLISPRQGVDAKNTIEVPIWDAREQAVRLLMKTYKVDRAGALKMIADKEKEGTRLINSLSLPEGAIADFVTLNGAGKPGVPVVQKHGTGVVLDTDSELGRKYLGQIERLKETDPALYKKAMRQLGPGIDRGVVVAKLTKEQIANFKRLSQKGKTPKAKPMSPATQVHRYLVIACTFPGWNDRSPRQGGNSDHYQAGHTDYKYEHPIRDMLPSYEFGGNTYYTVSGPGGPFINNGTDAYRSAAYLSMAPYGGRSGPGGGNAWNNVYAARNPMTYTTDNAFQNAWYNIIFNTTPGYTSFRNFIFQNSHHNVDVSGVLQDVKGWFRYHKHPLDVRDVGDINPATLNLPFPGTPILVNEDPVGAPATIRGFSSSANTVAFYWSAPPNPLIPSVRPNVTLHMRSTSDGSWVAPTTSYSPAWDPARRVLVFYGLNIPTSDNPNTAWIDNQLQATLHDTLTGALSNPFTWTNPRGQSLTSGLVNGPNFSEEDLTVQQNEVLQPRDGGTPPTVHWIFHFEYYCHNHIWTPSSSTYQLAHLRNNSDVVGRYDDLAGSQEHVADRRDRPFPYDWSDSDRSSPNGGVFRHPDSTPHHEAAAWRADVRRLLAAYGFSTAGYDRVIYLWPNSGEVPDEAARTGAFIPHASGNTITVPENIGFGTLCHELLHTYGAVDLYDTDLYYNAAGIEPRRSLSDGGVKNYSVMAGGMRVDPYTKIQCGWLTPTLVVSDRLNMRFPSVEDSGTNPVVVKIPINLPEGVAGLPDAVNPAIHEYFLIENHNRQLFGDNTALGLTIWHVDGRAITADIKAGNTTDGQKGMGDGNFLLLVPIQADGLYQIENGGSGDAGDPFPGSTNRRQWTQTNPPGLNGPNSRSRGIADIISGQIIPGTDFDTYIRLLNIQVEGNPQAISGPVIIADLYLQPRELIVSGTSMIPPGGSVLQGQTNVGMLDVTFTNRSTGQGGISTNDVTIDSVRIKQNGTSPVGNAVSRIALFDDSNGIAGFQPTDPDGPGGPQVADTLIGQVNNPYTTVNYVTVSGLNYVVQLGTQRHMFVVYDIAETAQTVPAISVGAMIELYTDVIPQAPGAIRQGVRNAEGFLISSDFPVASEPATINPAGDTLTVTPAIPHPAPTSMPQGTMRQPMLQLRLSVNRDDVRIRDIWVDQAGTSPVGDVVQAQLYEDTNGNGSFDDPNTGGADTLLTNGSASFNMVGGNKRAMFTYLNYLVTATAPKTIFVTYNISDFAQIPNKTVSANLASTAYIILVDTDDIVSPANFPIDSGGTLITRASHELVATGRDIAPPYADPDADPSSLNYPTRLVRMQKLVLSASKGSITVNRIRVDKTGTAVPAASPGDAGDIANISSTTTGGVMVYEDMNKTDTLDTADKLIGKGNFTGNTVNITLDDDLLGSPFAIDPYIVTAGTTREIIIAYDCHVSATVNRTMGTRLQNDALIRSIDVSQPGYTQPEQDTVTLKNQLGATVTLLDSPLAVVRGFVRVDNMASGLASIAQGSKKCALQRLVFTAIRNPSDAGDLVDVLFLQSLRMNKTGTSTASGDLANISLWHNPDSSLAYSGDETLIRSKDASDSGWPSSVTFDSLGITITASQPATLLVTVDVPTTATIGATVGTIILNSGFINGLVSPNGMVVGSTTFPLSSSTPVISGPIILSTSSLAENTFQVVFSGDMMPGTGPTGIENPANWQFMSPEETPPDEVTIPDPTITYDASNRTATITLANPQVVDDSYGVTITNATDTLNRPIVTGWIVDGNTNVRLANYITGTVRHGQYQPDCLIRNSADPDPAGYAGDGIYNLTGAGQTKAQQVIVNTPAVYYVRVQNDSLLADNAIVSGTAGTAAYQVRYWYETYDITNRIIAGSYVASGTAQERTIRIEVTPQPAAPDLSTFEVCVTATSESDPVKQDVVVAQTTKMAAYRPDAAIKLSTDATYNPAMENFYSATVVPTQTLSNATDQSTMLTYHIKIKNNGTLADTYRITAAPTAPTPGWTVTYWNQPVGGGNITASVLGGGFLTPAMAPGASTEIRVEITPDGTIIAGTPYSSDITVSSIADLSKVDVVRGTAVCQPYTQPDLVVSADNINFIGNSVYNLTGASQSVTTTVPNGQTATYYIQIQNDGRLDDMIRLQGTGTGAGFTVNYFDAPVGGADITAQVVAGTYQAVSLSQNATTTIRCEVTPDAGTLMGATRSVMVTGTSTTPPAGRRDAVVVNTTVAPLVRTDFQQEDPTGSGTWKGLNVIETSPSATQTVTRPSPFYNGETATFRLRLRNMGNQNDRFRLTATSIPASWTVNVTGPGGVDLVAGGITTANGVTTTVVAPLGNYDITITAIPQGSVVGGSTFAMNVYAVSVSDATKRDSSRVVATVTSRRQPDGLLKLSAAIPWVGDGVFEPPGTSQTVTTTVNTSQKVSFTIRIKNGGNLAGSFKLLVNGNITGAAGWTVAIYDALTAGANITSLVNSTTGWNTVSLAPAAFVDIRCELTPVTAAGNAVVSVPLRIVSNDDLTVRDQIALGATVNPMYQPDGLLRLSTQPSLSFDGIYDLTGTGANQTIMATTTANTKLDYRFRVQNDGNLSDNIVVTGTVGSGGWTVRYFDMSTATGTDITAQVTSTSGYLIGNLAAGGYKNFKIEATPDGTVVGGAVFNVVVAMQSRTDRTKVDSVRAQSSLYIAAKTDMLIRNSSDTAFIGDGTYNTTGIGQTKTQTVANNQIATYILSVQNDGNATDSFTITGDAAIFGWTARYWTGATGGVDITAQVTGAGYTFNNIAAGARQDFRVLVTPGAGVAGGGKMDLMVTGVSVANPTAQDTVKKTTTVGVTSIPDMMIQNAGDVVWTGNGLYDPPDQQLCRQSVANGGTVTYNLRVQNDGNTAGTIRITGPAGGSGWTLRYFDALTGGTNITSQVTGTGYVTASLSPGQTKDLRVEVTAGTSLQAGAMLLAAVKGTSTTDTSKQDTVQAGTTVLSVAQPDLQIRSLGEASYTGANVYSTDGSQMRAQAVATAGTTATYHLKIENDGNIAGAFVITAPVAPAGWTVKFTDALSGGNDITSQVNGGGWVTRILTARSYYEFHVEVTPGASIAGGTTYNLDITAYPSGSPAIRDVVRASTTLTAKSQPDMLIQLPGETSYTGNGIYNTTGTNQAKAQNIAQTTTGSYYLQVQNDGNVSTNIIITGNAGGAGWTVTYYDAQTGGANITAQVTGAGWSTGVLAPGAFRNFRVDVSPDATVQGGVKKDVLITATSAVDTSMKDIVKASSTATIRRQPDLHIRNDSETLYTGDNVYNTTGAGQTKSQAMSSGSKVIYHFRLQNDGTVSDVFRITGPGNYAGWTIKYYDALTGGTEITSQVTSSTGYTTLSMLTGASREFRVEVIAGTSVPQGASRDVLITAASAVDPSMKDAVLATSTASLGVGSLARPTSVSAVAVCQPDALIKNADEEDEAYGIDNVYQEIPTGDQIKVQSVLPGTTARFSVRIENDGASACSFVVVAQESADTNWRTVYRNGDVDITAALLSPQGYTTPELAPGRNIVLTVEMTASAEITADTAKTATVTVVGKGSDAVSAGAIVTFSTAPSSEEHPEHDVLVSTFLASPNPVSVGANLTFLYVLKNGGKTTERNLAFRITEGTRVVAGPINISSLPAGQQVSGTLTISMAGAKPGSYYVTGEVSLAHGETNTANNRQTIKVKVANN